MRKVSTFLLLFFISSVYANNAVNNVCPKINFIKTDNRKYVQIGENKIYVRTAGKGHPAIIFSSGTGFPADAWFESGIANEIAKTNKVFTYDRTNTFNSCSNKKYLTSISAQDVVNQLHQLLKKEKMPPPYILVGHSFGGLYMLLYAREFPDEVAGLLLMDASYKAPTPLPKKAIAILKKLGNPQNPTQNNPLYNEIIGQTASYQQLNAAPQLYKKIPLIVMYATQHCLPQQWTNELMCMTSKQEQAHFKKQQEIYNMSENHELIKIEGDHQSFFTSEKISKVISAIHKLVTTYDQEKSRG